MSRPASAWPKVLTGGRVFVLAAIVAVSLGPVAWSAARVLATQPQTTVPSAAVLVNTLLFAGVTGGVATLMGAMTAYVATRTTFWLRNVLIVVLTVPALLPPYVVALALRTALAPASPWVFTIPAVWDHPLLTASALAVLCYMPLALWITYCGLRGIPPAEEEHAALYMSAARAALRITLPRVVPELACSAGLVFLLCLQSFDICSMTGLRTLITEVFIAAAGSRSLSGAVACSVPVVLVGTLIAGAVVKSTDVMSQRLMRLPGNGARRVRVSIGIQIAWTVVAVPLLAVAALPLWNLVICAGSWGAVWNAWQGAAGDLLNATRFAVAATVLVLCGTLVVVPLLAHARRVVRWLALSTLLAVFAMPSAVLSLCMLEFADRSNLPLVGYLANGMPRIVTILAGRYLLLAGLIVACGWAAERARDTELAALHGVSWYRRWRWLEAPRVGVYVAAAAAAILALTLRELDLAILHAPPGAATLSARIFNAIHFGSPAQTASLCLVQSLATVSPVLLLWALPAPRGRQSRIVRHVTDRV
jgi:iron(III) transport system permease protein